MKTDPTTLREGDRVRITLEGEEVDRSAKTSSCLPPTGDTGGGPKEGEGPWLIRSHHWGRWHRRSEDGGACGYTAYLSEAGIFDLKKAREYHEPPGGRDEAIPVSMMIADMESHLAKMKAECDAYSAKIEAIRASWFAPEARRSTVSSVGEGVRDADEVSGQPTEPNPPNAPSNQES